MSILVVGTAALDTIQTPFGQAKDVLGGSAIYAALAASFFSKVKLIAVAGNDFPPRFISFLQSRNIDTKELQIKKGKTFRWSGRYSDDLNNPQTLKTELNLLADFHPHLNPDNLNGKFILLANIDPHLQLEVLEQAKSPKLVVADTMNYWIEHEKKALKQVIKRSDILILNDAEAREFSEQSNIARAARKLLSLGPRLVIIKRGEYGCFLFAKAFSFYLPAYLLEKVCDPTGAGDTFAGGFLGYLSGCPRINAASLKKAAAYGTVMSSYVIEDFSINRLSRLPKKDIYARLKSFQGLRM